MLNLTEPADGTRLVIEDAQGGLQIVHRDDDHARRWDTEPGQHWYVWDFEAPWYWEDLTRNTVKVYTLTPYAGTVHAKDVPGAVFSGLDA